MAWTYSGVPDTNVKDKVRFLIGDTLSSDPLLQDEEILALTSEYPNPLSAAAYACEAIAARFSRQTNKSLGGVSIGASTRAEAYAARARELRARRRAGGLTLFSGGRSFADKDTLAADTNAPQPNFSIGQDDFPITPHGSGGE